MRISFTAEDGTVYSLREPTVSDAKAMMRYFNPIVREKPSWIIVDKAVTLKEEESWLENRLGEIRRRTTVMLVAETDGRMVGNCHATRLPWKARHRVSIGIALAKGARGKGLGRELMERTMDLAEKRMRGVEVFELDVFVPNKAARALYEGLGFVEYARVPSGMKEEDVRHDEILMRLPIKKRKRTRGKRID